MRFLAAILLLFAGCAGYDYKFSYTFPTTVSVEISGSGVVVAPVVNSSSVIAPTLLVPAIGKGMPVTATVAATDTSPKLIVPVVQGGVAVPTLVNPK